MGNGPELLDDGDTTLEYCPCRFTGRGGVLHMRDYEMGVSCALALTQDDVEELIPWLKRPSKTRS